MTVYWWIFAYTSVVSLFGTIVKKISKNKLLNDKCYLDNKSINLFFAILTFALLVFFVGSRNEFNDTYYYRDIFQNYITGDLSQIKDLWEEDSKSKYFLIVQSLFKHFVSKEYNVWFFALAIFQIGAVIKLYYKYSVDYFMSAYLFISSVSFVWMMGGIRQFLAVCIVLYGIDYLIERKTIKFLILVLIASLFHISAIIWIPIYFICTSKPWSWKIAVFIIGIVLMLFSIDTFTTILDDVLEETDYSGITSNFDSENGVNGIRVLVTCVPWILALMCKRQIDEDNNQVINICVNLSVVSSAIYLLGMFTSGIIVGRLPIYFMLTNYILIPWILNRYFTPSIRMVMKTACIVMYFLYFYYDMVIKGTGHYGSELLNIPYV